MSPAPSAPSSTTQRVREWLESPYVGRVASRVAYQYRVRPEDIPDLLQELRLALWKAGPDLLVNATWIFHTANHKAVDIVKRRARLAEEERGAAESAYASSDGDSGLRLLLRARAARLPKRLYDFYLLRYQEGLSQREVAKRLGLCRGSIRCLDRRFLQMMKGRLTG